MENGYSKSLIRLTNVYVNCTFYQAHPHVIPNLCLSQVYFNVFFIIIIRLKKNLSLIQTQNLFLSPSLKIGLIFPKALLGLGLQNLRVNFTG